MRTAPLQRMESRYMKAFWAATGTEEWNFRSFSVYTPANTEQNTCMGKSC